MIDFIEDDPDDECEDQVISLQNAASLVSRPPAHLMRLARDGFFPEVAWDEEGPYFEYADVLRWLGDHPPAWT